MEIGTSFWGRAYEVAEGIYGIITGDPKWRYGGYARNKISLFISQVRQNPDGREDYKTLLSVCDLLWSLEAGGGAFFDHKGVSELSFLRGYAHHQYELLTGEMGEEDSVATQMHTRPSTSASCLMRIACSCRDLRELSLKVLQDAEPPTPESQEVLVLREKLVSERAQFSERMRALEQAVEREAKAFDADRAAWRERAGRYKDELEEGARILAAHQRELSQAEAKVSQLQQRLKEAVLSEAQPAQPESSSCNHKQVLLDLRNDLKAARMDIAYYEEALAQLQADFEKTRDMRLRAECKLDQQREQATQQRAEDGRALAKVSERLLEVLQARGLLPQAKARLSQDPDLLVEQLGKIADHLEMQALAELAAK